MVTQNTKYLLQIHEKSSISVTRIKIQLQWLIVKTDTACRIKFLGNSIAYNITDGSEMNSSL